MKKKLKHVLIILIVTCVLCSFYFYKNLTKKQESSDMNLKGDFLKKFDFTKELSDYNSKTLIGYQKDKVVEVKILEGMDSKSVDIYISDALFMVNSLFKKISSPYPGVLSNRIECPEEFKPLKIENRPFDYYILYASDRFTYGVCSLDLIKYKSILYFLYCDKEKKLYHIKLFIPVSEDIVNYEVLLRSVRCL